MFVACFAVGVVGSQSSTSTSTVQYICVRLLIGRQTKLAEKSNMTTSNGVKDAGMADFGAHILNLNELVVHVFYETCQAKIFHKIVVVNLHWNMNGVKNFR